MAGAKMTGADEVLTMLQRLSGEALIPTVEKGIAKTMNRMVRDAKNACPKDSGELYKHITYRIQRGEDANIRAELVAPTEYAIFVEMGTGPKGEAGVSSADVSPEIRKNVTYNATGWVKRNIEEGKTVLVRSEGMAPNPFLYPAYKTNVPKLLRDVKNAAQKVIEGGNV